MLEKLINDLQDRFDRWEHLYTYGGSDPFYSDGLSMRLVRNHIAYYKNKIKEFCDERGIEYPEAYHRDMPPEVDRDYMAGKDEIRASAIKSLEIYESDESFNELEKLYPQINNKNKKQIARNILGYRQGLRQAVKENDYITMRRHMYPKRYLESPKNFLAELEPKDFEGQVKMF